MPPSSVGLRHVSLQEVPETILHRVRPHAPAFRGKDPCAVSVMLRFVRRAPAAGRSDDGPVEEAADHPGEALADDSHSAQVKAQVNRGRIGLWQISGRAGYSFKPQCE